MNKVEHKSTCLQTNPKNQISFSPLLLVEKTTINQNLKVAYLKHSNPLKKKEEKIKPIALSNMLLVTPTITSTLTLESQVKHLCFALDWSRCEFNVPHFIAVRVKRSITIFMSIRKWLWRIRGIKQA